MLSRLLVLACIFCFVRCENTLAAFQHYGIEEGLSQSVVFNIQQDQQGFMWFATQDGLNRFDGNQFEVFKTSAKSNNSLSNNYIYPLLLDSQNQLFIGTRHGGVNHLNLFSYQFASPQLENKRITALLNYKNWLIVGTFDGMVYRLNQNTAEVELIANELLKPVYALTIVKDIIWIGTHGNGLHHFDLKENNFVADYLLKVFGDVPIHPSIFAIKQSSDSHIWLATQGGGVYEIDLVKNSYQNWRHDPNNANSLSSDQVRDIAFDQQGRVWLATRGAGVSIYDRQSKQFSRLEHDPFDRYSLAHNRVYSVFQDQTGIMWFGTANGISKLDPTTLNFNKLKKPNPLTSNDAWALYEDPQQRIWYGSWGGGIDILDRQFNRIKHLDKDSQPLALSSNAIKAITQDQQGNTWIGTWADGIDVITKQGQLISYKAGIGEHGLTENSIYCLLVDKHNDVWVGTNGGGLFRFDSTTQQFISYAVKQGDSNLIITAPRVTSIYQDNDQQLWLATDGKGAYRYDFMSNQLTNYTKQENGMGLSHNTVRAFLRRDNNDMWLATSDGINILSADSEKIIHIGLEQGLPNQVVYGLLSGKQHNVWLSTNNGLVKIDSQSYQITHFQAKDGLQGNEFNAGAYLKSKTGQIFFGGTQGVTVFQPGEHTQNQGSAKLALTALSFDDNVLVNRYDSALGMHYEIEKSRQLEIAADVQRVSLTINYLHYLEPDKNQYRYRLTGFEQQWRTAQGSNLKIDYTNLPPGQYQLIVEAFSKTGVQALAPVFINFNVLTPWWRSWVFYIGYFFVGIAAIWLCIVLWTRRLRHQKAELEEFVALRTQEIAQQKTLIEQQASALSDTLENKVRFFTHASHELRTPLSLLVAPLQALLANESNEKKRHNLNLALRNAKRLENLVDKLLTLTRFDESSAEEIKYISLSAIAREVAAQFNVLGEQQLQFDYQIDDGLYVNASREGLITIFSNLLSNAFKYTTQGEIEFIVLRQTQQVKITVRDTGRGIAEVERDKVYDLFYRASGHSNIEGSGVGLSIVKRLVDKYKGKITLSSTLLKGTEFTVLLDLVTPLPKRTTALLQHVTPVTSNPNSNKTATILVVEDNDDLRHYLHSELSIKYKVLTAENGKVAMDLLLEYVPDLIITDLMMPEMDGFSLLQELHRSHVTCHIPAIILTAKGDHDSKLKGLNHYAMDVITKPFERAELLVKVDNWVDWVAKYHQQRTTHSSHSQLDATTAMIDPKDSQLLINIDTFLAENYHRPELTVPMCAKQLALSERQLQRKLKVLVNVSPTEYIRDYRLTKAAELIRTGQQINLVIEKVGFTSRSHFSKTFKAKYNMTAKEFQCSN
ncbi:hypothetical protein PMAG_a2639 [Pseudoalteromonas mariniglutinosa NCIMB 1770]|nr:hypothetical protein [Pseudoalteromonas mariniglutinosa NCIMB 1770]